MTAIDLNAERNRIRSDITMPRLSDSMEEVVGATIARIEGGGGPTVRPTPTIDPVGVLPVLEQPLSMAL